MKKHQNRKASHQPDGFPITPDNITNPPPPCQTAHRKSSSWPEQTRQQTWQNRIKLYLETKQSLSHLSGESIMKCEQYASYETPGYYLVNNIWNPDYVGKGKQCIEQPKGKSFAWNWDWSNNPTYTPLSYPSVIFGDKPWDPQASSTKSLPRQLSQINKVNVAYNYALSGAGRHNVAFDFWLTEGKASNQNSMRVEVMVWLEASGSMQPYGKFKKETPTYKFYAGELEPGRRWATYSFQLKQSKRAGTIDLNEFLKVLTQTQNVSPSLYLADVEFGTEIWDGKGSMNISSYDVQVS